MSDKNEYQDFEELINHIVANLSDSELLMIRNADPAGIHLALDRWIKSEFLSNSDNNVKEIVSNKILEESSSTKDNIDVNENIHPDDISGFIIQQIIRKIHQ